MKIKLEKNLEQKIDEAILEIDIMNLRTKMQNIMKIYLRKLKSGNYEIANENNFTHEFETKEELEQFFSNLHNENTTIFNRRLGKFKSAQIIKSKYSQSQTYFTSFEEFWKSINK